MSLTAGWPIFDDIDDLVCLDGNLEVYPCPSDCKCLDLDGFPDMNTLEGRREEAQRTKECGRRRREEAQRIKADFLAVLDNMAG